MNVCTHARARAALLAFLFRFALDSALGSAALFPVSPLAGAFTGRTLQQRTEALRALATSALPPRRKAFNGLKRQVPRGALHI